MCLQHTTHRPGTPQVNMEMARITKEIFWENNNRKGHAWIRSERVAMTAVEEGLAGNEQ
jgi:hypothetical protein